MKKQNKRSAELTPKPVTLEEIDAEKWDQQNPIVTLVEQERRGMRRQAAPVNYVPPARSPQQVQVLPPVQSTALSLDVPLSAVQTVEFRTSHVDRANGFIRVVGVLAGVASLLAVLVAVLGFNTPWFSISALVIFFTVFTLAWLWAWLYTLRISPEGISYSESKSKWKVIELEQKFRHDYYRDLSGQSRNDDK